VRYTLGATALSNSRSRCAEAPTRRRRSAAQAEVSTPGERVMTSHTEAAGSESNRLRSDWWSGSLHRVRRTSRSGLSFPKVPSLNPFFHSGREPAARRETHTPTRRRRSVAWAEAWEQRPSTVLHSVPTETPAPTMLRTAPRVGSRRLAAQQSCRAHGRATWESAQTCERENPHLHPDPRRATSDGFSASASDS
jgi:hypothetical protein